MISELIYDNGKLTWTNDQGIIVEKDFKDATYINDANYVVALYENDSIAVALDENGEEICRISNSDDTYLMYLMNHRSFKLCVVASLKNGDAWRDTFLRFDGKKFVNVSNAR